MLVQAMNERTEQAGVRHDLELNTNQDNHDLLSAYSLSLAPSPIANEISTSSSSPTQESVTEGALNNAAAGTDIRSVKQEALQNKHQAASQRLSSTTASRVEVRLLVRRREAGALIGKRGANIKRLRETFSGSSFNIPDTGNGPERIVCIVADSLSNLEAILLDVATLFQEKSSQLMKFQQHPHPHHPYRSNADEQIELKQLINSAHAGLLIGMGGNSIRKLRNDSKAAIKIYEMCCPLSNERVCAIKAKPHIVVSTIKMIQEIIEASPAALKASIVQKPYDALNFDLNLIDKYGGYLPDELSQLELLQLASSAGGAGLANPTNLFVPHRQQYPTGSHRQQSASAQHSHYHHQRFALSARNAGFLRNARPHATTLFPTISQLANEPNAGNCPLFADALDHHHHHHHQLQLASAPQSAPLLMQDFPPSSRHPSRFHPYLLPSPPPLPPLPTSGPRVKQQSALEHEQQRQIIQRHLQILSARQSLRVSMLAAGDLHAAATQHATAHSSVTPGHTGCLCHAQLTSATAAANRSHHRYLVDSPAGGSVRSCSCLSACETEQSCTDATSINSTTTTMTNGQQQQQQHHKLPLESGHHRPGDDQTSEQDGKQNGGSPMQAGGV